MSKLTTGNSFGVDGEQVPYFRRHVGVGRNGGRCLVNRAVVRGNGDFVTVRTLECIFLFFR